MSVDQRDRDLACGLPASCRGRGAAWRAGKRPASPRKSPDPCQVAMPDIVSPTEKRRDEPDRTHEEEKPHHLAAGSHADVDLPYCLVPRLILYRADLPLRQTRGISLPIRRRAAASPIRSGRRLRRAYIVPEQEKLQPVSSSTRSTGKTAKTNPTIGTKLARAQASARSAGSGDPRRRVPRAQGETG